MLILISVKRSPNYYNIIIDWCFIVDKAFLVVSFASFLNISIFLNLFGYVSFMYL